MNNKILVVDDEPMVLNLMRMVLEKEGYEVIIASNGRYAFSVMVDDPDVLVVISDYAMPEMDGLTLIEKIVNLCPNAKTCLVSANFSDEVIERAERLGAKTLAKPFQDNQDLVNMVAELFLDLDRTHPDH